MPSHVGDYQLIFHLNGLHIDRGIVERNIYFILMSRMC